MQRDVTLDDGRRSLEAVDPVDCFYPGCSVVVSRTDQHLCIGNGVKGCRHHFCDGHLFIANGTYAVCTSCRAQLRT